MGDGGKDGGYGGDPDMKKKETAERAVVPPTHLSPHLSSRALQVATWHVVPQPLAFIPSQIKSENLNKNLVKELS